MSILNGTIITANWDFLDIDKSDYNFSVNNNQMLVNFKPDIDLNITLNDDIIFQDMHIDVLGIMSENLNGTVIKAKHTICCMINTATSTLERFEDGQLFNFVIGTFSVTYEDENGFAIVPVAHSEFEYNNSTKTFVYSDIKVFNTRKLFFNPTNGVIGNVSKKKWGTQGMGLAQEKLLRSEADRKILESLAAEILERENINSKLFQECDDFNNQFTPGFYYGSYLNPEENNDDRGFASVLIVYKYQFGVCQVLIQEYGGKWYTYQRSVTSLDTTPVFGEWERMAKYSEITQETTARQNADNDLIDMINTLPTKDLGNNPNIDNVTETGYYSYINHWNEKDLLIVHNYPSQYVVQYRLTANSLDRRYRNTDGTAYNNWSSIASVDGNAKALTVGDIKNLITTDKSSIVSAINETFGKIPNKATVGISDTSTDDTSYVTPKMVGYYVSGSSNNIEGINQTAEDALSATENLKEIISDDNGKIKVGNGAEFGEKYSSGDKGVQIGNGTNNKPNTVQYENYRAIDYDVDEGLYLADVGKLKTQLKTTVKSNAVDAINELFDKVNVSDKSFDNLLSNVCGNVYYQNSQNYSTIGRDVEGSTFYVTSVNCSAGKVNIEFATDISLKIPGVDIAKTISGIKSFSALFNPLNYSNQSSVKFYIYLFVKPDTGEYELFSQHADYIPEDKDGFVKLKIGEFMASTMDTIGDVISVDMYNTLTGETDFTINERLSDESTARQNADAELQRGIDTKANKQVGSGGFAGGDRATINIGGTGGAIGAGAKSTENGFAGGAAASVKRGGAIGDGTYASNGGAVGQGAKAQDGFAGGKKAIVGSDENHFDVDAIQLGTGLNINAKTLQVYDKQITNADGSLVDVGNLINLHTVDKTDIVTAINCLVSSIEDVISRVENLENGIISANKLGTATLGNITLESGAGVLSIESEE